ncbi:hypothetical protein F0223_07010 [Vibrio coralliilyticus]|uniref:hypothetical protein n=1 Tax=Vibrio TaxID=662 RepID=UPI0005066926|nr:MULTISPECIES: hypothetical protein [Vibrio]KFI11124.1 hypothetical protein IX95_16390 [Vibrio sp. B183]NOI17977.1 hypothetical protein [Vibrio coralliilyticus]
MESEGATIQRIADHLRDYVFSDDVTVTWVLRAHLAIESSIDDMLHEFVPSASRLTKGNRFSFSQKLEMCMALELLNDRMYTILKSVNTLRNSCAHNLLEAIVYDDLQPLSSALGREACKEALESTVSKVIPFEHSGDLQRYLCYLLSSCVAQMSSWVVLYKNSQNKK